MSDSYTKELAELHQWLVLMANESDPHDSQMLMKAANVVGQRFTLVPHVNSMCGWAETLAAMVGWKRENAASFWASRDAARNAVSEQSR
jgi:hypothetical protein